MTPAGRPEIGPMISTRYTREQLIRIDGAAARAGQSRAEWFRDAADRALGPSLDMPTFTHEYFTEASHRPEHFGDGRFDAVLLTMSPDGWAIIQRPRELLTGRAFDEVLVEISPGGGSTPTGPAVESVIENLLPYIERVISDAEMQDGRLVLGEDAQHALDVIKAEASVSEMADGMIADGTTDVVESIGDEKLLAAEDLESLVAVESESLREDPAWWVDQETAVGMLEERREELQG